MRYRFSPLFFAGWMMFFSACMEQDPPAPAEERPYLDAARDAALWLDSARVETPHGPIWPADVFKPETISTSLSDGVAGIVMFYLELHRTTEEPRYLDTARHGADYLLATLPSEFNPDSFPPASNLYGAISGVGFALNEVYKATNDESYRAGALRCVELLHAAVNEDDDGAFWADAFNDLLYGNPGTALFLLYAAREMNHAASRTLAASVGRRMLALALPEHGGLTWPFRQGRDFILPNFSHGAAGIGYVLATLHQDTGEANFLDAAQGAATYLQAIARTEDGGFLVPYGWPNPEWEGYHDIGWAHGPAGTARLFYRLWQITGEAAWMDLVQASARGIRQSGLPDAPNAGFGTEPFKPDLRFGTVGVALFFLDLHHATGDQEALAFARQLTDHLLGQATRDAQGLRWEAPRYAFFSHGGEQAAFTGYFYGAAGYGLLLLRLDAALQDSPRKLVFPDDPFTGL